MSEAERIALLKRVLGAPGPQANQQSGIGDDAAILDGDAQPWVWTVDAQVAGVHFERRWLGAELGWDDLGWRATMAAASDLAAMGAEPRGLLASLVLPRDVSDAELEAIARGQAAAATFLGTAVCGGNLSRGSELALHTTALGVAGRPLLRSGARAGDALWLAGAVGLAAAGLLGIEHEPMPALAPALAAFRRPIARIADGLAAAALASAAIDVSDGLALDAAHLAAASGVRLVLEADALGSPELTAAAALLACDANELALHGGEDYALLAASPVPIAGFRCIGRCVTGEAGVVLARGGGEQPLLPRGFDHFR